jgi:hypothetical protein
MTSRPPSDAGRKPDKPASADDEKPDTNEVQHEPDPKAEPIPGAPGIDKKWHPKSPYTTGNV